MIVNKDRLSAIARTSSERPLSCRADGRLFHTVGQENFAVPLMSTFVADGYVPVDADCNQDNNGKQSSFGEAGVTPQKHIHARITA